MNGEEFDDREVFAILGPRRFVADHAAADGLDHFGVRRGCCDWSERGNSPEK
jgi:hypothetical protein